MKFAEFRANWVLEGTFAAALLAAGVTLYITAPTLVRGWAFSIPGTTDVALEPSFFPRLAAILLAAAAVVVLATMPLRQSPLPALSTNAAAYLRVTAGLAAILVYLIAVNFIGFVVSTTIFIIAATFAGGYRRWLVIIPSAILIAVGLRLVFRFGLHVGLPLGILY